MNMFNAQGQLNASSMREAAVSLAKYASILEENLPSNQGLAGQVALSDERRDDMIAQALQTQSGKIALAQAMANPIR